MRSPDAWDFARLPHAPPWARLTSGPFSLPLSASWPRRTFSSALPCPTAPLAMMPTYPHPPPPTPPAHPSTPFPSPHTPSPLPRPQMARTSSTTARPTSPSTGRAGCTTQRRPRHRVRPAPRALPACMVPCTPGLLLLLLPRLRGLACLGQPAGRQGAQQPARKLPRGSTFQRQTCCEQRCCPHPGSDSLRQPLPGGGGWTGGLTGAGRALGLQGAGRTLAVTGCTAPPCVQASATSTTACLAALSC